MAIERIIIGIDEVGRGPLAGPLTAVAVALKEDFRMTGLTDSKLLSAKKRVSLVSTIRAKALDMGIGWASSGEIDSLGLTAATALCMRNAIDQLKRYSGAEIIIDGNYNYLADSGYECRAVIKADQTHPAVSAASVIAKVARDSYMRSMAGIYPGYGFEKHVGYGTVWHRTMLANLGPSPLHRMSFKTS